MLSIPITFRRSTHVTIIFYQIDTSTDTNSLYQVHKFSQKIWDATGKLIKAAISKNEMKYDRCANIYGCYLKLTQDLAKNGQGQLNKKWLEWKEKGDEKILQKIALKENRTFIGLGTEHKDEYKSLASSENHPIIYTDRESIPYMAPILGTQSIYQLQGDSKELSSSK